VPLQRAPWYAAALPVSLFIYVVILLPIRPRAIGVAAVLIESYWFGRASLDRSRAAVNHVGIDCDVLMLCFILFRHAVYFLTAGISVWRSGCRTCRTTTEQEKDFTRHQHPRGSGVFMRSRRCRTRISTSFHPVYPNAVRQQAAQCGTCGGGVRRRSSRIHQFAIRPARPPHGWAPDRRDITASCLARTRLAVAPVPPHRK